jgi:hypothetical protein
MNVLILISQRLNNYYRIQTKCYNCATVHFAFTSLRTKRSRSLRRAVREQGARISTNAKTRGLRLLVDRPYRKETLTSSFQPACTRHHHKVTCGPVRGSEHEHRNGRCASLPTRELAPSASANGTRHISQPRRHRRA